MKPRKLCFSILVALLASFSILPAHAELVTLHEDDFWYITTGTNTTTTGNSTPWSGYDNNGTGSLKIYDTNTAYRAGGSVRLGKDNAPGSITTTNIVMQAGVLRVQVDVKGWSTVEGQLLISIAGQSSNITYTAVMAGSFETVFRNFTVAEGSNTVTFATTAKRCFLDNILITQDVTVNGSQPVFSVTGAPTSVEELTPISFTVDAKVGGSSTNVTCVATLPPGASYVFENSLGEFNWTPSLGQAGSYSFGFSAYGSDAQSYTSTVNITVNALTLTAPANLAVSNVKDRTFDASWNPVTAATQGYVVDVWYGSSAIDTPNADLETFFESINKSPVQPLGWIFSGITAGYNDKKIEGITLNEIAFDTQDDTIITRLYPKGVTNFAFRIQGRSTSNSVLRVSGSADGTSWTEVAMYSSDPYFIGDDENKIFTAAGGDLDKNLVLSESLNYRQFRFAYTKDKGNVGIGNIAAMYEGAGTKFIPGWQGKATVSTLESIAGGKPSCPHYIRVGAKNASSTEYSTIRFQTLDAPASTLITLR